MTLPNDILELGKKRLRFKIEKKYKDSDLIRKMIEDKGYSLFDDNKGQQIIKKNQSLKLISRGKSLVAVFGSGEMSPTGRKVHEHLIKNLLAPVKIALLETPTGFEENPHHWYEKMDEMLTTGLKNYNPIVKLVPALRKEGPNSTNDQKIVKDLLDSDYIHSGAGSPTYAAKHLHNSLAYQYLIDSVKNRIPVSFASATAIAFSKYLLPVYEIYKVGDDLHWKEGLDFFGKWGLNLTFIPHWNNTEGGSDIDTTRCYMGEKRYQELVKLRPGPTTIIGIDEQTACVFDMDNEQVSIMGVGRTVIQKDTTIITLEPNSKFEFALLK